MFVSNVALAIECGVGVAIIGVVIALVIVFSRKSTGTKTTLDSTPRASMSLSPTLVSTPSLKPSITPRRGKLSIRNPIIPVDHPDVHPIRVDNGNGTFTWYITTTETPIGDGRSGLPLFKSVNFVDWTLVKYIYTSDANGLYNIGGKWYKRMWAPQLSIVGKTFVYTITGVRHQDRNTALNDNNFDGSSVFYAISDHPEHEFGDLLLFTPTQGCTKLVPYSFDEGTVNCNNGPCDVVMRLDSNIFVDPLDGRIWLSYAWYSNEPPTSVNECSLYFGEHIGFTELDQQLNVKCNGTTAYVPVNCKVATTSPMIVENGPLGSQLQSYCGKINAALGNDLAPLSSCSDNVDYRRGRFNDIFRTFDIGGSHCEWCIAEAPSMLRRGNYVYLFFSGSAFDSPNYCVAWIAAKTVPELCNTQTRLAGQFIVPFTDKTGVRHNFGHGHPVMDAYGDWWFACHHMNQSLCRNNGNCARDVYMCPIDFVDIADGLGDVWILPISPLASI